MISLGHLDVNVVTHCNKRCTSCSHASPFTKAWEMSPETLERDLNQLKEVAKFHRIQMVGGEPTLHRNLVAMMKVSRSSGIAVDVSVITNGKLLPRMTEEFWDQLDVLQLSVYPDMDRSIIELAQSKCSQRGKPCYVSEFTEFHKQFRATPSDGSNFHSCHWKSDCYTVHEGHFALCPQSLFFPKSFMGLDQFVDCLPLDGVTPEVFSEFLSRSTPLNACRICIANELKPAPWQESANKESWFKESTL